VKCYVYNVIERHIKNPITIPIYYTKYIAENESSIPQKYKELLESVKNQKLLKNIFLIFFPHKSESRIS
jgi:hypothetical protein